ncbi:hypothetical protein BaRGS_00030495, partial [Batillaria attramentaria]
AQVLAETGPSERHHRNALRTTYGLWPARRVPYTVDDSVDAEVRGFIEEAIEEYHTKTCIQWIPRTREKDYVVFKKKTGCYSAIGRVGNAQELSLVKPCAKKGTAMHEMLHVLGFFHEHSRPDRDPWVQILLQNVEEGKEGNFDRLPVDLIDTLGVQYDYGSIMHYSRYAFSANGQPTLLPKHNPNAILGQRTAFSDKDLEKINKLYRYLIPPTAPPASTTGPPAVTQPPPGWTPWGSWSECDLQCRHYRYRFCMNTNESYCQGDSRQVQTCPAPCQPAVSLGCWANEPSSSAIPSVDGLYPGITDNYQHRTAAVRRCADVATSLGYAVFALQNGGQCLTGPEAVKTFNTYGPSRSCGQQGKGGSTAINVYSFNKGKTWTEGGARGQGGVSAHGRVGEGCSTVTGAATARPLSERDTRAKGGTRKFRTATQTDVRVTLSRCGVKYHVGTPGKSGYINLVNYDNYMTCEYVIESGQDDDTVSLVVTRMDIEASQGCMYDALMIYDGVDDTGHFIGAYCGTGPMPRLQSSSHALFVRFQSDSTTTGAGFSIQFAVNDGT